MTTVKIDLPDDRGSAAGRKSGEAGGAYPRRLVSEDGGSRSAFRKAALQPVPTYGAM